MIDLSKENIAVFGGTGFIGTALCKLLERQNAAYVAFGRKDIDLLDYPFLAELLVEFGAVFNLIGENGGIEYNRLNHAKILYSNTVMNFSLLNAAKVAKCKKVLSTVASCAYDSKQQFLSPDMLLSGSPHHSVIGHGYAKRNVMLYSKMLSEMGGSQFICVTPTTVFGPGDSLDAKRAKVVGSLIIKFILAKRAGVPFVQLLGDGSPFRQFIYVKDLAKLLLRSMEIYDDYMFPIHLASDDELTIRDLAELVKHETGYTGKIVWGDSSENGQFRKKLLTRETKAEQIIYEDFQFTPFGDTIRETVQWYEERL